MIGPAKLSFLIDSLRNPYSTSTSDSFEAAFKTRDGIAIATQSTDLTTSASVVSSFKDISIIRGSKENGAHTSYKFKIQLGNPAPAGGALVVTLPSEVTVLTLDGAFADCAGQGNLKSTLVCKPINKQIVIALEFSSPLKRLSSGEFLEFEIFNVKNPGSLRATESFAFELKTSDRVYLISAAYKDQGI